MDLALSQDLLKTEEDDRKRPWLHGYTWIYGITQKLISLRSLQANLRLRTRQDTLSGEQHVARHNQQIKDQLKNQLHEMDPGHFESLIAVLLTNWLGDVEVVEAQATAALMLLAFNVGGITN
ncbi:MAG: hypothetical protein R2827_12710 [Bdellovibrionales bacterium]